MSNQSSSNILRKILFWSARVLSIISIGVMLLFFVGERFSVSELTFIDWVGFVFFPAGVMLGMIVAWWKEGLGGIIILTSLLAFYGVYGYILNGAFPAGWAFCILSFPGVLFILSAAINKKK